MGLCGALVCVRVVLVLVVAEHRVRFAVLAGREWLLTTAGPLKIRPSVTVCGLGQR